MQKPLTSSPAFRVRSLASPAEVETFFRINAEVFRPDEERDLVAANRQRLFAGEPDFHLRQLRSAFLGEQYLGGYALLERTMCLGPVRLRTGCISGVGTLPDYRLRGIARALMLDAIDYARSQPYALLLLHGLPNFYQRFGYVDVLEDIPQHFLARRNLPELPSGAYTVRPATSKDAPAVLACYQRHYGSYLGSFAPTRTLQRQAHLLTGGWEETRVPPLLAVSPADELHGYLMLARRGAKLFAYEAAAETWLAALALMHAHDHLLAEQYEPPHELAWPLPPQDSTFYLLADHCVLRSELVSSPDRGWMARPGHLPTLLRSLLPLWQHYWRQRPREVNWSGTLALCIENETCLLVVDAEDIQFADAPATAAHSVSFSPQDFAQLIFGFRPVAWLTRRGGVQLPADLVPLLNVLFPPGQAWIAGSDFF